MKRTEIAEKYKWDTSLVLENDQKFYQIIKELDAEIKEFASFEGKLNTAENILLYFKKLTAFDKKDARAYLYAMLNQSVDGSNPEYAKQYDTIKALNVRFTTAIAFVDPELAKLSDEFLDDLIKDKRFVDYDRVLLNIKKQKKHTLSKQEETLMAGIGNFAGFSSTFRNLDDIEIKFKKATDKNGKRYHLDNASYGTLIRSQDEKLRKTTHINLHKGFSNFNLTISQNYINQLKYSDFCSKSYKYKSKFDSALFNEEIDKSIYENLIESVHGAFPLFYRFADAKRRLLNQKEMNIYDFYVSPFSETDFQLEYDEAIKLVIEAVKPLGEDYQQIVKKAVENRWIDVYPTVAKRGGAYSVSCGTGNPFVLLNYGKTFNDIQTIAHELGHAMHSYYSEQKQPYPKQDYVIFVAEVASTVNEILLCMHVLNNTKEENVKKLIINNLLQDFYSTIFRQTMFAEFEYKMHNAVNKNKIITFKDLNNTYSKLQKQYFGKDVKIHKYAKYEWSRIPHFYTPFYVYKYATGFISAVAIVQNIIKYGDNYAAKYKEFLSSGCATDPVNLLKIADIDISDPKTFNNAFSFYEELLNQYEDFCKE